MRCESLRKNPGVYSPTKSLVISAPMIRVLHKVVVFASQTVKKKNPLSKDYWRFMSCFFRAPSKKMENRFRLEIQDHRCLCCRASNFKCRTDTNVRRSTISSIELKATIIHQAFWKAISQGQIVSCSLHRSFLRHLHPFTNGNDRLCCILLAYALNRGDIPYCLYPIQLSSSHSKSKKH